jgi:hypothetical protein
MANQSQFQFINPEGVSTIVVHWATQDGERTGKRVFSGSRAFALEKAKRFEYKLWSEGMYTHVQDQEEYLIHD